MKEGVTKSELKSLSAKNRLIYLTQSRLLKAAWFRHLADKKLGAAVVNKGGLRTAEEHQAYVAAHVIKAALEKLRAGGKLPDEVYGLLVASFNKWMGDLYRKMQRISH
ncbi:MAG: hypothetical protein RLZZ283_107 [Candidatus Parcubacteria bacterium]|jgi:hypothetical protein